MTDELNTEIDYSNDHEVIGSLVYLFQAAMIDNTTKFLKDKLKEIEKEFPHLFKEN